MKSLRLACLALILASLACRDAGTNPWNGWNQRQIGKAAFAVPADMLWVEVDGRPWGLVELWATPDRDQSLRVEMFYGAGLDTSHSFPPQDCLVNDQLVVLDGYLAHRLTCLFASDVWEEITAIWIPDLRDNGNQMLFMVIQYGKPSPQAAADIMMSLRVK